MKLMFDASGGQQAQFEKFFEMMRDTNEKFNLTAIVDKDEAGEKHFFDSVQAAPYIKQGADVVDVGAGAGFPGVPLKIMRTDINLTLVDSLTKRVNFLNEVGAALNFKTYNAVHARAEDFAKQHREKFDVAVARAVAALPTLCELTAPLVKVGGSLILYKGSDYAREVTESQNAFKEMGLKLRQTVLYELKNAGQQRALLILEKVRPTPVKYPRGQNKPKTEPIL